MSEHTRSAQEKVAEVDIVVFRALYYDSEIKDQDVSVMLAIDNLVESGYTMDDVQRLGFTLPNTPLLPAIVAGIKKGKARYTKRMERDAETNARMKRG